MGQMNHVGNDDLFPVTQKLLEKFLIQLDNINRKILEQTQR